MTFLEKLFVRGADVLGGMGHIFVVPITSEGKIYGAPEEVVFKQSAKYPKVIENEEPAQFIDETMVGCTITRAGVLNTEGKIMFDFPIQYPLVASEGCTVNFPKGSLSITME